MQENLENVMNAIDNLPLIPTNLPIFSAQITGNPHYFDKCNLAGKLLIIFLEELDEKRTKRKSAEDLSELYYKNNLLIDEMSNMVLAINLYRFKNGVAHHGWREMADKHEAFQITIKLKVNLKSA